MFVLCSDRKTAVQGISRDRRRCTATGRAPRRIVAGRMTQHDPGPTSATFTAPSPIRRRPWPSHHRSRYRGDSALRRCRCSAAHPGQRRRIGKRRDSGNSSTSRASLTNAAAQNSRVAETFLRRVDDNFPQQNPVHANQYYRFLSRPQLRTETNIRTTPRKTCLTMQLSEEA